MSSIAVLDPPIQQAAPVIDPLDPNTPLVFVEALLAELPGDTCLPIPPAPVIEDFEWFGGAV